MPGDVNAVSLLILQHQAEVADQLIVGLVALFEAVVEEVVVETAVDQEALLEPSLHPVHDLVGGPQFLDEAVDVGRPIPVREGALRSAKGHDYLFVDAGLAGGRNERSGNGKEQQETRNNNNNNNLLVRRYR